MKIKPFFAFLVAAMLSAEAYADIAPTATYTSTDGEVISTTEDFTAEAPLHVRFTANASGLEAGATFEWHFRHQGAEGSSNVTRYEEDTEFDFTESGVTEVSLVVRYADEVADSAGLRITISESHLEMPNAFSPNGDGVNDIYRAKENHKSIVSFHAYIFNRWGQKLYDWTDIHDGWDGTFNGHPVKDGVYFVLVEARGADGINYHIKRDVNLLRKFNEATGGTLDE